MDIKEKEDLAHQRIDKISFEVLRVGGLKVKFNVKLAYPDTATKERRYFHMEYNYNRRGAYNDRDILCTLNLNFTPSLLIEPVKGNGFADGIYIGYRHVHQLIIALEEARKWFYSHEFHKLYMMDNNKLVLNSEISNGLEVFASHLGDGKSIRIIPAIVNVDEEKYEGVVMYLNNTTLNFPLMLDEFDAFYYVIKSIGENLFTAGQNAINYIGRPEFGIFSATLSDGVFEPGMKTSSNKNMSGRKIGETKNSPFNPLA